MKFVSTFLAILISVTICSASQFTDSDVESSLRQLDTELRRCDNFKLKRIAHLDSLKTVRRNQLAIDTLAWLHTTMEIAKGYNAFNNDSSIIYYTQGYDCALLLAQNNKGTSLGRDAEALAFKFRVRRATYMSLSGLVHDAINEYEAVDTLRATPDMMRVYHDSGRQMFSYISSYYSNWLSVHDYWQNRAVQSQIKLLPLLDPTSDKYLLNRGEYYFNIREYSHSKEVLLKLLDHIDYDNEHYAIAAHILASIAMSRGDRNEYMYYLTRSAIADMRHATLEVTSLQELAGVLFETGDKSRAHNYISEALSNAVESRASVRMMQTTELLKMVEEDHNSQIALWRSWMYAAIAVLAVVLLALLISMFYLRRQLNHVARMKQELQDANNIKDVYISQFLSLCSIYMDKLKQFCKLANRKISAGQVDDLYKITKSGKFIEEQSVEFYKVFDDAFLHIYPNFVEKVNALLRPEEQIQLNDGETLNSDLRILAFMRLGIDDTTRVAQILNFSVNTIYAYRNRMRNRAINRDTFEKDILAIGSIDDA
jgi:tetratricopeptide (TPR) repeat protein